MWNFHSSLRWQIEEEDGKRRDPGRCLRREKRRMMWWEKAQRKRGKRTVNRNIKQQREAEEWRISMKQTWESKLLIAADWGLSFEKLKKVKKKLKKCVLVSEAFRTQIFSFLESFIWIMISQLCQHEDDEASPHPTHLLLRCSSCITTLSMHNICRYMLIYANWTLIIIKHNGLSMAFLRNCPHCDNKSSWSSFLYELNSTMSV